MRSLRIIALLSLASLSLFPNLAVDSALARSARHSLQSDAAVTQGLQRVKSLRAGIPSPTITGNTYFVSPNGSDDNSGNSPLRAWRTVDRVNQASLRPGDAVLFEGGSTFSDSTLVPPASGAQRSPIVFGSYGGGGLAHLPRGVWFVNRDNLTFDSLLLGASRQSPQGLQGGSEHGGTADRITVQRCTITLGRRNASVGIYARGRNWTIRGNTIRNIGNSGMLLLGSAFSITANVIENVGFNRSISYGTHGIYLKVAGAVVSNNYITNFRNDGISPRYRDSVISANTITHGGIGIGFFQYDHSRGISRWTGNTIEDMSAAGVYVSGADQAGATVESFVIAHNLIQGAGRPLSLQAHTARFKLAGNNIH